MGRSSKRRSRAATPIPTRGSGTTGIPPPLCTCSKGKRRTSIKSHPYNPVSCPPIAGVVVEVPMDVAALKDEAAAIAARKKEVMKSIENKQQNLEILMAKKVEEERRIQENVASKEQVSKKMGNLSKSTGARYRGKTPAGTEEKQANKPPALTCINVPMQDDDWYVPPELTDQRELPLADQHATNFGDSVLLHMCHQVTKNSNPLFTGDQIQLERLSTEIFRRFSKRYLNGRTSVEKWMKSLLDPTNKTAIANSELNMSRELAQAGKTKELIHQILQVREILGGELVEIPALLALCNGYGYDRLRNRRISNQIIHGPRASFSVKSLFIWLKNLSQLDPLVLQFMAKLTSDPRVDNGTILERLKECKGKEFSIDLFNEEDNDEDLSLFRGSDPDAQLSGESFEEEQEGSYLDEDSSSDVDEISQHDLSEMMKDVKLNESKEDANGMALVDVERLKATIEVEEMD